MDPINIYPVDKLLIFIYLAGILTIGLISSKKQRDSEENFLLAGRRLSLPAFTATLVSTWYGGILGVGEFTYLYGLLNWVTQALPYYLFAILFAFFIAPKLRKSEMFTIPDQLYSHYGKTAGLIGSIFIFFLVSPASYLLMISILLRAVFGIPFWIAILIGVCFSTLYVFFGGFKSVVKTDLIQFVLMFVGFIILIVTLYGKFGGMAFLRSNLPENHLRFDGGRGLQYMFVWFFIALWTFVDPGFYQRCYAVKNPGIAKNGIILAVVFWVFFDFLTTTAGLYARALFQDVHGLMAFPMLGELILPPVFQGIFFISLLATIMSTLDSNSFLAAVTFGRDIIYHLRKDVNTTRATQIGLVLTLLFSITLMVLVPSVVRIWYLMGSLLVPALLLPTITVFFPTLRLSNTATTVNMLAAFMGSACWLLYGIIRSSLSNPVFPKNIQPFFIGLVISLIIYLLGHWKKIFRRYLQNNSKQF